MKRFVSLFLCGMLCVSLLTGCKAKERKICVTMYPIQYLVEKIAGDKVAVSLISDGDIVTRSHIKSNWEEELASADLFLYLGQVEPYLQIYLPEIRAMEHLEIINLASTTSLYKFQRYTYVSVGESEYVVESPYYEGSVFNNIDIYDSDPYIWMDPVAMTSIANQIRNWLSEHYPEETEYFNEQYQELETSLAMLDSQYQLLRANSPIRIVTLSSAFGTWQKNYGIQVYPIILSRYGVLPNEDQLAAMEERIRKDGVDYIVHESNLTEDMEALYQRIKSDLNLIEITMSNLESITATQLAEHKDYIQIMYENLAMLESIVG